MFIDTSVFVAILCGEPEAPLFAAAIERAARRFTSPMVRLETCMVASTRLDRSPADVEMDFDAILIEAAIEVAPITDETSRLAVRAFERFGKGRGTAARLNLADCFSYASARALGAPILFKGRDFAATELGVAVY
ncbi:type II toxin-antitoxin system VapC family toxin [Alsobacter metallidurans]|nr:type II toxin-antitoxin system VapC family toxin [Alsobacter metallidurans]